MRAAATALSISDTNKILESLIHKQVKTKNVPTFRGLPDAIIKEWKKEGVQKSFT